MTVTLLEQLINALRFLPGIGPKSAQRMALHILQRDRANALTLSKILEQAVNQIGHCQRCNTFSEHDLCRICSDARRNKSLLCVVETPADVLAIEQMQNYFGLYFVLMGHLSPLDGIGPQEIGVNSLLKLLSENTVNEVILATNPTVEGEATAHYLASLITSKSIKCSRIAHGVPMGGELEYLDGNTLARAFLGRVAFDKDPAR